MFATSSAPVWKLLRVSRDERIRRIVLLLTHRLDYLPTTGLAQSFPSKPGAVPTEKVACGCARLERGSWAGDPACHFCKGSGFRRRIVKLDGPTHDKDGNELPEAYRDERGAIFDPMTYAHDRRVKAGNLKPSTRTMTREETDRELARLRADKRARVGVHLKTDAYGWERARERRDRSGSFRELDQALNVLAVESPVLRALLDRIFRGEYKRAGYRVGIPQGAGRAYWQALLFLEARMPDPIRVPQYLTDTEDALERHRSVAETFRQCGSIGGTARRHGLRKDRVKAILAEAGMLAA